MNQSTEKEAAEYPLWHGSIRREALQNAPRDTFLVEGKGVRVCDAGGRWFLDARSSLRTVTLGYDCQPVIHAAQEQLGRLPYSEIVRYARPSNVAVSYAEELIRALPDHYSRVRFTTSGSRMVDEALILSRFVRVSGEGAKARTAIIANTGAWHGLGGLSTMATGYPYIHDLAGPLSADFHHVSVNDFDALAEKVAELGANRVCAVLLEPALGVAGCFLDRDYVSNVEDLCRRHEIHLIMDEVTTGAGRLGSMSFAEQLGVQPDILILGKGLTSGYVPVSALIATEPIYQAAMAAWPNVVPHASTNDGHPAAMAAGLAVLDFLRTQGIFENVLAVGEFISGELAKWLGEVPGVMRVEGHGLMHFIHIGEEDGQWGDEELMTLVERCEEHGLLVDCINGQIILTPPLITNQHEAAEMLSILASSIVSTASSLA